ncbi:MAG: ATP-binding cassette domain-containing protein [Bauldia sp.]|nr:ATP-binding cassette domain-containing protein [Bauldia sp.]
MAEAPAIGAAGLQLKHVSKRYGGVVAVNGVSFTAIAGEVHALLGENGAGKSTLMGIASGDVRPDTGTVEIGGEAIGRLSAAQAQRHGLAIVHQHPAVLPDLTVAENMALAVPAHLRRGNQTMMEWVASQLERVGCAIHPKTRMTDVGVAQRQLIELAKALAIEPKVLILDEPTAPLTADLVDLLFEKIREAARRGAAIIYISHRLQEVRQIANRVTVMRDGEVQGSALAEDMSDDEMLRLIVGRSVTSVYPEKGGGARKDGELVVKNLSGRNFHDVSMVAGGGEIVGIAGIVGNGQSEFLRSLAGLINASGEVSLGGNALRLGNPESAYKAGVIFLSSERQTEGLLMRMSVRENAALAALPRFAQFGVVRGSVERAAVEQQRKNLAIRTASIDANVGSLSGGNQQKVILARALLANPSLVLAEEPTAGVDVGARAEIYSILREIANAGTPVIIVSSDTQELEGLCDRVIVFSRGHNVGELTGDDVTEEQIGRKMITATTHRKEQDGSGRTAGVDQRRGWGWRLRQFAAGDYAPSVVLAILILALGAYATDHNIRFVSAFNIEKMLLLAAALAFIGYGQACAIFTGGIDVSVGPLVGLVVVISSFFFSDGSVAFTMIMGLVAMIGAGALVGFVNGSLIRFGNFTSVAATLGIFIILQGFSVLLRPTPGGPIRTDVIDFIQYEIGGVPIAFVVALLLGIGLEIALRHTRWGLSLRGVGSDEVAASRIGVATGWVIVGAFVACSVLTALGGIMVMAQLGIGDANQGVTYTLSSIAAVVLGGASLFGGRGAFIGVLFGAVLIQVINSTTTFLSLSGAWQYWFIGGITLGAVAVYSQARRPRA